MIFHFSREGMCYLLDGEPHDFFDIDKNYLQSIMGNYPRFEDYCKTNDYIDGGGNYSEELQDIISVIKHNDYKVAKINESFLGTEFTSMIYIKDESAVIAGLERKRKYKLSIIKSKQEVEAEIKQLLSLVPGRSCERNIGLDLSSSVAEEVLAIYEDDSSDSRLADKTGLRVEDVKFLLDGVQGSNRCRINVFRNEDNIGAIAFNMNLDNMVAMRFVTSPRGDLTCFESIPNDNLLEYILDFKEM